MFDTDLSSVHVFRTWTAQSTSIQAASLPLCPSSPLWPRSRICPRRSCRWPDAAFCRFPVERKEKLSLCCFSVLGLRVKFYVCFFFFLPSEPPGLRSGRGRDISPPCKLLWRLRSQRPPAPASWRRSAESRSAGQDRHHEVIMIIMLDSTSRQTHSRPLFTV